MSDDDITERRIRLATETGYLQGLRKAREIAEEYVLDGEALLALKQATNEETRARALRDVARSIRDRIDDERAKGMP